MSDSNELSTKKKKSIRKWASTIVIYSLLFLAVGWGVDLWRTRAVPSDQILGLVVNDVQGDKIDLLAMSKEEPVLLYFWATWCSVCSTVSPSVDFMSAHYPVLSIAISSGNESRIKHYIESKGYDFKVINDQQGVISKAWGVSQTPTIFIIDKGEIKSITTGFTSPIGMWLRLLMA